MGESQYPGMETPIIQVESDEGDLILHYFNTKIRTFKDEQFNHIELIDDEGGLRGIRATADFIGQLLVHDFPRQYDPVVDEMTKDWFVDLEMQKLEQELDGL